MTITESKNKTITPEQIETLKKLFDLDKKIKSDEDFLELVKDFDEDE